MRRVEIYPSILSADFSRLGSEITDAERAGADGIHVDVMDGHFVPNLTIGPLVVRSIRPVSSLPYWAHLMITDPLRFAKDFRNAGVDGLTIHPETGTDLVSAVERIRGLGGGVGLALRPETPIDVLDPVIGMLDRILVLTVHPGFGGQTILKDVIGKIRRLRDRLEPLAKRPLIEVDGGIDPETTGSVIRAGADVLIAGQAVFGCPDRGKAVRMLRKAVERALSGPGPETH
ncbi:ribulose-phosphate 3-epimerase [bacterium]|nr:ribulose-phosphate 3-epimerase [bacterium]